MSFDNLLVERDGSVAIITLNRPSALNVLNIPLLTELGQVLDLVRDDVVTRAVVITGAGDKAFAAGADIRELSSRVGRDATLHASFGQSVFHAIEGLGKPVIAALNGFALGGGCELAMACTLRVAADTARIGQPEINLGIMPGFGGTARLPRLVGMSHALDLLLTGRTLTASEALGIGLVNRVVPAEHVLREAVALASEIATKAPRAVRAILEVVRTGFEPSAADAQQAEAVAFGVLSETPDAREGIAAFLEKRSPRFTGR